MTDVRALANAREYLTGINTDDDELNQSARLVLDHLDAAEQELDATRERARVLIEAATPGAEREDAVCMNIRDTALHVVGATRKRPSGCPVSPDDPQTRHNPEEDAVSG